MTVEPSLNQLIHTFLRENSVKFCLCTALDCIINQQSRTRRLSVSCVQSMRSILQTLITGGGEWVKS